MWKKDGECLTIQVNNFQIHEILLIYFFQFHEILFFLFLGAAGPRYSMDLGSDGYESPGSALMGRPGFSNYMPYGIRTPDSLMSTGSRDFASSAYGAGWKLPGKNYQ